MSLLFSASHRWARRPLGRSLRPPIQCSDSRVESVKVSAARHGHFSVVCYAQVFFAARKRTEWRGRHSPPKVRHSVCAAP